MNDIFAAQLMDDVNHAVRLDASLQDAASVVAERGCAVVIDEEQSLVGVATTSHIVNCVANGFNGQHTLRRACIRTDLPTVKADTPVQRLIWLAEQSTTECLPVVDDEGRVLGVLHAESLASYDV